MGIDQLVNQSREKVPVWPQGYRGKFAKNAVSGQKATVTIDDFGSLIFEDVPWMSGASLPVKGDPCLVLIDDGGAAWVACWWPS